jgi:DNA-binding MarR family transcriptional regulator
MERPDIEPPEPQNITELLSFRLHQLASLSSVMATMRYERKFKLTLLEWRAIAMLGGFPPMSLKDLARRAGLDKSYASRTLAALIERGLVTSTKSDSDGRGVMLSLSREGKALYRKVFPDAVTRNERLLQALGPEQREQLNELLGLVQVSARRLLDEEKQMARSGENTFDDEPAKAADQKSGAAVAQLPARNLDEMSYLIDRLSALVKNASR